MPADFHNGLLGCAHVPLLAGVEMALRLSSAVPMVLLFQLTQCNACTSATFTKLDLIVGSTRTPTERGGTYTVDAGAAVTFAAGFTPSRGGVKLRVLDGTGQGDVSDCSRFECVSGQRVYLGLTSVELALLSEERPSGASVWRLSVNVRPGAGSSPSPTPVPPPANPTPVPPGPMEITRVTVRPEGASPFFADAGGTYPLPTQKATLWVEWDSNPKPTTVPRLDIVWGDGNADNTSCGSCQLTHAFSAGLYTVTVRVDNRVGSVATRTFNLDTRPPPPARSGFGTFAGALTATDPVFDRFGPDFAPPTVAPCATGGVAAYLYDTYAVTHSGGPMTISTTLGTLPDSQLQVYSGSFNPAAPCQNIVASDNDSGGGQASRISAIFPAGNYIVVVASRIAGAHYGTYTLTIQ